MKLKNFIFVTFFLAAASLGSALPPKHAKAPATDSIQSSTSNVLSAANSTQSSTGNVLAEPANGKLPASNVLTEQLLNGVGKTISADCLAVLGKIITSPEFSKCVPLTALTPIAPIALDPTIIPKFLVDPANVYKTSIEKPLTQFADGICAAPKCSDQGVAGAVQLIQDKCKNDLDNPFIQTILAATILYTPIRDILCLKDNNQYCWDKTLLDYSALPKSPIEITKIPFVDGIAAADPKAVCTSCPQQLAGTFIKDVQGSKAAIDFLASQKITLEEIELVAALKCGAKFLNPGK